MHDYFICIQFQKHKLLKNESFIGFHNSSCKQYDGVDAATYDSKANSNIRHRARRIEFNILSNTMLTSGYILTSVLKINLS